MERWLLLLSLVYSSYGFAKSANKSSALELLLESAEEAVEKKNYPAALSFYLKANDEAIRSGDKDEQISISGEAAKLLYLTGQYEEAYSLQSKVVMSQDSAGFDDRINLAHFAYKAGLYEEADQQFTALGKQKLSEKQKALLNHHRAQRLRASYQYDEAVKAYLAAGKSYTLSKDRAKGSEMLVMVGNVYQDHLGDYKKAFTYYKNAKKRFLQLNDKKAALRVEIDWGNALVTMGRVDEAIELLNKVKNSIAPKSQAKQQIRASQMLANAYYRNGDFAKATSELKGLFALLPKLPKNSGRTRLELDARNLSGLIECSSGNSESCFKTFTAAKKLAKSAGMRKEEAYLYNNMGHWSSKLGRSKEAVRQLKKAAAIDREIRNDQGLSYDLRNLGLAYLAGGQKELAEMNLQWAMSKSKRMGLVHNTILAQHGLGKVHESNRDFVQAAAEYKSILDNKAIKSFRMEHWMVLSDYAAALTELKEFEEARSHFSEALSKVEFIHSKMPSEESQKSFKKKKSVQLFVANYVDFLVLDGRPGEAKKLQQRFEKL